MPYGSCGNAGKVIVSTASRVPTSGCGSEVDATGAVRADVRGGGGALGGAARRVGLHGRRGSGTGDAARPRDSPPGETRAADTERLLKETTTTRKLL
jgi:hypothetical protein